MLRREIKFFEKLNKSSQHCQKHVFLLNFAVWITRFYLSPQRVWNVTEEACADMWRGAGGGDTHSDNETQRKVAANVTQIQSDFFFF